MRNAKCEMEKTYVLRIALKPTEAVSRNVFAKFCISSTELFSFNFRAIKARPSETFFSAKTREAPREVRLAKFIPGNKFFSKVDAK